MADQSATKAKRLAATDGATILNFLKEAIVRHAPGLIHNSLSGSMNVPGFSPANVALPADLRSANPTTDVLTFAVTEDARSIHVYHVDKVQIYERTSCSDLRLSPHENTRCKLFFAIEWSPVLDLNELVKLCLTIWLHSTD